ncbi:hypothetical protein [Streptomyces sp. SYSU K21746]
MKHRSPVLASTLLAALALTGCGSSTEDAKATPTNSAPNTLATEPTEDPAAKASEAAASASAAFEEAMQDAENALGETIGVHPGTYEITEDSPDYEDLSKALDDEYIAPGTYKSKGPADGSSSCYWARMSDASGDTSSILANDISAGSAIVTLNEGEFFKTSGCKPWTKQAD